MPKSKRPTRRITVAHSAVRSDLHAQLDELLKSDPDSKPTISGEQGWQ